MKTRIMKAMLLVLISMVGISVQAYDFETTGDPELDYLNVYFKDGTFRIFHFSSLKSLFTSSIDAEGYQHSNNQFQHITTLTDQFVFDLADIDRIEFTKYKEEVVLDNIAKTMEVVLPLVTNCETIADAENIIEEVKQCENVEDAWSDGHEFQVKIKDWETMSFHFNHGVEDEATMAKYKHKIKSGISKIKKNSNINIQRPKVVVANQRDNNLDDKYFTSAITSIVDALKTEGFDAEYVPMPSLDFFYEDMYDYDVVLLTTHGGYSSRRHDFMTGLELGKIKQNSSFPIETAKEMWKGAFNRLFVNPKYSKAQDDIGWTWHEEERNVNGQIEKYWVAYATVFESFFQHTASKKFSNQNSILFNSACMSLKGGNQVADIFMEHRNLGTYLGYDESNYFGPFSGSVFIVNLLTGMSAEKAKEELNNIVLTTQKGDDWTIVNGTYSKEDIDAYNSNGKYIRSYTAELHMLPESNHNRFVTKVCTIEKDNSEINQEYSSNHSVKLEGVAGNRSNEGIKIYYGFEFTEYEPITKTWNIDAESTASDGMVEFYANLSNLQPGKTYQYRAYTFDGMNYNYGEPCSFTIEAAPAYPDLQLSQTLLSIIKGGSATVEITAGSGEYGVTNLNSSIARGTLQGTTVTIDGVAVGNDAKIVVTDMQTGQKIIIEITVTAGGDIPAYTSCPDSHHPHLIDLGLPSGTKWACCNVGASKPEDYGGYYAWGETTEKSHYDWSTYIHCDGSSSTRHNIGNDISGTQYDAATANWGSSWKMPNKEQMEELTNSCTSEWTTENGVNGRRFIGPNGASIFLPAAGIRQRGGSDLAGSWGLYWSSTLYNSYYDTVWFFSIGSDYVSDNNFLIGRPEGLSVRPVVFTAPVVSQTRLSIVKGNSSTVEIIAGCGEYSVTNLNSSIAKATLQGTTVTINALAEGDAKVVVTDTQSGQQIIIEITVTAGGDIPAYTSCPDNHHPHLIDLGLPSGTKWACCNVGAEKPEDYGGYFAWGETTEKSRYYWDTYTHCDGSQGTCHHIGQDIFSIQYDAATANWGSSWKMPNKEQMEELTNSCTSEWTTENGVNGRRFIGPNGASIFLPAAGIRSYDDLYEAGSYGEYWSSTLSVPPGSQAWNLRLYSGSVYTDRDSRCCGQVVRPVCKN